MSRYYKNKNNKNKNKKKRKRKRKRKYLSNIYKDLLNYNINHSILNMLTNTVEFKGFKFEYFVNDCMASNSIGKQEDWERHMTKFVQLYDSFYKIQNIIDVGANFGYHTVFF